MAADAYIANHKRIRSELGKAKDYSCFDCQKPAFDWSQTHGTDGSSNDHFKPRCRSCHLKYDFTPERAQHLSNIKMGVPLSDSHRARLSKAHMGQIPYNRKLSDGDVAEIKSLYATGNYRYQDIADMYGVSYSTIGCAVRGEHYRLAGK